MSKSHLLALLPLLGLACVAPTPSAVADWPEPGVIVSLSTGPNGTARVDVATFGFNALEDPSCTQTFPALSAHIDGIALEMTVPVVAEDAVPGSKVGCPTPSFSGELDVDPEASEAELVIEDGAGGALRFVFETPYAEVFIEAERLRAQPGQTNFASLVAPPGTEIRQLLAFRDGAEPIDCFMPPELVEGVCESWPATLEDGYLSFEVPEQPDGAWTLELQVEIEPQALQCDFDFCSVSRRLAVSPRVELDVSECICRCG